jgi:hypothetical protein
MTIPASSTCQERHCGERPEPLAARAHRRLSSGAARQRALLKCGILHYGFARLKCQGCGRDRFLAYSCRTRQFCPSCAAKRSAAFTDWVASEVLEPVSHRQVVFTIPKVLRPVFRKNRKLLGLLCRCAWDTLKEMHQGTFPEEDVRGAAVIAVQTAGDQLGWHPHLHALVTQHVPDPGEHTRHYFGHYSNAARGKRRQLAAGPGPG